MKVEAKGYKTNTRSLSATRVYPNLSDADLELIPKTIMDGGKTLTLGAVEWSGGENGFHHRHRNLHRHLQHPLRHRLHSNGQLHLAGGKDRL